MDTATTYTIEKVFLEIQVASIEQAHAIKQRIDAILEQTILPAIEAQLDQVALPEAVRWQTELLTLQIDGISDFSHTALSQAIAEQWPAFKALDQAIPQTDENDFIAITQEAIPMKTLLFFLRSGHLPWWVDDPESAEVQLEALVYHSLDRSEFKEEFSQLWAEPIARKRSIKQLTHQQLAMITVEIADMPDFLPLKSNSVQSALRQLSPTERIVFWEAMISGLLLGASDSITQANQEKMVVCLQNYQHPPSPAWKRVTEVFALPGPIATFKTSSKKQRPAQPIADKEAQVSIHTDIKTSFVSEQDQAYNDATQTMTPPENSQNEYHVQNAGLILLHPFLGSYLSKCQVYANGQFKDTEKAVHLLHFLATGKEQSMEGQLLMEKFLCGIPMEFPIERFVELSARQIEESEVLLKAVLSHLPQLKSDAPQLLQNEFLQRSGKLVWERSKPRLIVERKTQDILLDRLSWNISMVKLPWMNELLFVEW